MRGERKCLNPLFSAIEKDQAVLASENRRGLVEQPAIHTDEFIFRLTAKFGDFERRERKRV
jgi:hypothetical protein